MGLNRSVLLTRYVDYAMQRIRLLRHHKITPYVVFDGGPLPAKQHTENDRKQRREENLAKAKALTAQGKHTQAREFYLKCVDVTPQMAYQFIKASKHFSLSAVLLTCDVVVGTSSGKRIIYRRTI